MQKYIWVLWNILYWYF